MACLSARSVLQYMIILFCKSLLISVYSMDKVSVPDLSNNKRNNHVSAKYEDSASSSPTSTHHRSGSYDETTRSLEKEFDKNYDDLSDEVLKRLEMSSNDKVSETRSGPDGTKVRTHHADKNTELDSLRNIKKTEGFMQVKKEADMNVKRNVDAFEYPGTNTYGDTGVGQHVDAVRSAGVQTSAVRDKSPVAKRWKRKKKIKWRHPRRNRIRIGRKLRTEIKSFYQKHNISYTVENGRLKSTPIFELLHNIEFLNTTQSILSLRHMQKKRLNKIYQVYMNNSLQLLRLESNLHHISADLTTEKDIKNLDTAIESYRNYVERIRVKASKDIRDSLKDIDSQSENLMDNLAAHLNHTIEWKHYVSDQLVGVCEYLQVTEKQTLHDLKKVVKHKNRRIEQLEYEVKMLKSENERIREEKSGINSLKRIIVDFQQNLLHNQQTMESVTSQLHSIGTTVSEIGYAYQQVTFEWRLHAFDYDNSWTDCYGPRYLKLSGHMTGHGKYVGVILCSPSKFKIFLGDDIHGKFLNIGDRHGNGEDHCEFVSYREARFLSESVGPSIEIEGYGRADWGELAHRRKIGMIHGFRSPKWYDCGITIP